MKLKDVKKQLINSLEKDAREVFLSDEYRQILTGTMYALLKNTEYSDIALYTYLGEGETAMTDGEMIRLAVDGTLSASVKTNEEKYLSHIGLVFHECGHLLYTNFKVLNRLRDGFCCLGFLSKEVSDKYFANNSKGKYEYARTIDDMVNIIEDMYIENCLEMEYSGQVVKALKQNRASEKAMSSSKEELERLRQEGKMSMLQGFSWLLHDYCNVHYFKDDEEWTELKRAKEVLDKIKPTLEKLKVYQEGDTKAKLLTSIAKEMLALVESPSDNRTTESKGKEQNTSQGKVGSKLDRNLMSSGKKAQSEEERKAEEAKLPRQEQIENAKTEKSMEENFESVLNDIAKAKTEKLDGDKEVREALKEIKRETNKDFRVIRPVNDLRLGFYNSYKKEVATVTKQAVNLINNVLKTREDPDVETKLTSGGKVVCKDLWKGDGKYFSQYREGDEVPDVAFGLIVDGSGSMGRATDNGSYLNGAVKAAIALKEMCNKLDIPCAVISHSDYQITKFATFEDDTDFKKIASHRGRGGTCDSMSLYTMGEMLLQRPEKEKIMIIISDGEPNRCIFEEGAVIKNTKKPTSSPNAYFDEAVEETKTTVKAFKKCGVQTYGVALYCYKEIKEIYGNDTIECKSLNELPKKLAKILKRAIFK